jgi:kynureninase
MRDWRRLGVDGFFAARHRGSTITSAVPALAALVGAQPREVTVMNTLTVNLHLLLASFYRPAGGRTALLIERHGVPVGPLRR